MHARTQPQDRRKGDIVVNKDEEPTSLKLDKVPGLRPAFKKDGTVTAANASSINDGGAAMVIMSKDKADALGVKPLAVIRGYGECHCM